MGKKREKMTINGGKNEGKGGNEKILMKKKYINVDERKSVNEILWNE